MNIIAAVDKHWAIGNRGKLLVTIPDDQKLFREETKGKVIVMGRKTLESLPAGQPLAGRKNVVLTRDEAYMMPTVQTKLSLFSFVHSLLSIS